MLESGIAFMIPMGSRPCDTAGLDAANATIHTRAVICRRTGDGTGKTRRLDLDGQHDRGGSGGVRDTGRRVGVCRAVDPRKPRTKCSGVLLLAARQYRE